MRRIAVVTDTASDLSLKEIETYDIKMLHYQIVYEAKTYKDQLEIHSKEVLDRLEEEIPSTSLPSLDEMHALFKDLIEQGYEEAIIIPLSSGLSGCYNAINMVKDEYKDKINAVIYDSKTISAPQGLLAVQAAKMVDAGWNLSDIVKRLDEIRSHQVTYFMVDTLKYLVHGGRIGHVSATVGTLLNLKPIITIGDDGKYETVTKVRGRVKAVRYLVDQVSTLLEKNSHNKLYFSQADGEKTKNEIIADIRQQRPEAVIEGDRWISPVACVHCGPGYVGVLIQDCSVCL